MKMWKWLSLLALALLVLPAMAQDEDECEMEEDTRVYTSDFNQGTCKYRNRYRPFEVAHQYWIMEPGWQVVLEGEDDGEEIRLEITVLDETELVNGVKTRIIEEREFIDGELYEVSRNFFAFCTRTQDVFYFGEDVDFYEDGEIVAHDGAWRAGEDGAVAGIIFPATVMVGARFFQEVAPGIAEDRAEVTEIGTKEVNGMVFENVVVFSETSPLDDPCSISVKYFAPGIGMIRDDDLELVEAGYVFRVPPLLFCLKIKKPHGDDEGQNLSSSRPIIAALGERLNAC